MTLKKKQYKHTLNKSNHILKQEKTQSKSRPILHVQMLAFGVIVGESSHPSPIFAFSLL